MRKRSLYISAIVIVWCATSTRADDASDAKAIALEFVRAIEHNNDAYLTQHFAGTPSETKLLAGIRESIPAAADFRAACIRRFGPESIKDEAAFFDPAAMLGAVQQCDVILRGDIAHLRMADADTDSLTLQKIDAVWKITSLTGTPGKTAQLRTFLGVYIPVVKRITPEIETGQFATIADVRTALRKRVIEGTTQRSATQPSP